MVQPNQKSKAPPDKVRYTVVNIIPTKYCAVTVVLTFTFAVSELTSQYGSCLI